MDFSLTEEQEALRRSARNFLTHNCTPELVEEMMESRDGHPTELWEKMAGLGWQGLILPSEYGGSGGNFLDLIILLEEMGRVCLPGPFSTTNAAAFFIMEAGSKTQKNAILTRMAAGELIVTPALLEPQSGYDMMSVETVVNSSNEMHGTKLFVPYAGVARFIICPARTERGGLTLYLLEPDRAGVSIEPLSLMGFEKQYEVRLEGVPVSMDDVLGEGIWGHGTLEKTLDRMAVARCAEMVGGLQSVLDMTVAYVGQREQSGRPIGAFQAIQHYCADMLRDLEGSRFITYKAAWEIEEGLPSSTIAAIAKAWVSDAYQRTVLRAHQIFGGIGFCREHPLHHRLKHAKLGELAFGDAAFHLDRVATSLGL